MSARLVAIGVPGQVAAFVAVLGLLAAGPLSAQSLGSGKGSRGQTQDHEVGREGLHQRSSQVRSQGCLDAGGIIGCLGTRRHGAVAVGRERGRESEAGRGRQAGEGRGLLARIGSRPNVRSLARAESLCRCAPEPDQRLIRGFTACQAPPQCNEISAKRQKSIAELDRVKKEVAQHTKGIADIQEEARRAGVPAGWVR